MIEVSEVEWNVMQLQRAMDDCLQHRHDVLDGILIPEKEWRMLVMAVRGVADAAKGATGA